MLANLLLITLALKDNTITILSSVKPFWSGDSYDKNQQSAIRSWIELGFKVVLFNYPSEVMMDGVVYVQPRQNPPTIKEILDWFSVNGAGYCAIVNADIRLEPSVVVLQDINKKHTNVWAATSFRYDEFEGVKRVIDMGLDFFAFPKNVANNVRLDIPDYITLGRGGWDNWMNGWLSKNLPKGKYFDLTDHGFVIHPRHDREPGRLASYSDDQIKEIFSHPAIKAVGIPRAKFHK